MNLERSSNPVSENSSWCDHAGEIRMIASIEVEADNTKETKSVTFLEYQRGTCNLAPKTVF